MAPKQEPDWRRFYRNIRNHFFSHPLTKACPAGTTHRPPSLTLVCPIQLDGCPRPGADAEPGLALAQAEERKSRTYPEFGQQGRCKLVVLALEVGGRWSTATQTFLRALARGRALASPSHSRAALAHALQRRWGQMLTVAANAAFSSSLLELPATAVPSAGALTPPLAEVVADARWT